MIDLHYVVITSVSRDDLDDGGASYFVSCVEKIRAELPGCGVELLIPDFRGSTKALQQVFDSHPNVISHNMEVASALFDRIRPEGNYRLSLQLLKHIKRLNEECAQQYHVTAKSGFMVGFGETRKDIEVLLSDIVATGCRYVTIGQYQQPTMRHWPVAKYYHPEEFAEIKTMASAMGFDHVESGPHVRSSYRASFACPKPYQWTNSF
jgi:lipoic acid synthetase